MTLNTNHVANVLRELNCYQFTTAEFIFVYQKFYPKTWAKIVTTYGVGGRGNPTKARQTSHTYIATELSKQVGIGSIKGIGRAPAPSWWGNKWINLWQSNGLTGSAGRYGNSAGITPVEETPQETTAVSVILSRKGQGKFRTDICHAWNNKCAVTGCSHLSILRASHIKPWSASTDAERLSNDNGILFAPNIDSLFDQFLISFDNNGKIILPKRNKVSASDLMALDITVAMKLSKPLNKAQSNFMDYHRNEKLSRGL
ncbi:MAG: HNH endonuclease [Rhodoferax sp.]|nr:HNH endonuclease [Rhodoferax sp.]